jgi:hypothetical protein
MNQTVRIKQRLIKNITSNSTATNYYEHKSAIIFKDIKDSFIEESYENIKKNDDWNIRTIKKHNSLVNTLEMQSSNSSDALLMNIFCYPKINQWKGLKQLLDVEDFNDINFGWNPFFENEDPRFPTEIDMKIGKHIFEAKLTENNFTQKNKKIVENYKDLTRVFDIKKIVKMNEKYENYQLIRNIITAYKYNFSFTLIIDESRTDLIRYFLSIIKAIKNYELQDKINFITWQEIADVCGKDLKNYLERKYF